ncbi:MAG: response regulator [Nitrospirae bacterium]|nr:response regulator [Nitrospirota bacterium]MBF0536395.1 response regulator [Nitrospirota bacterium]MBF0618317.1 response regulator [Nitrospirota bacterium]
MRILIAEDDFVSRTLLQDFLSSYGDVDITINGSEAVEAFSLAFDEGQPYDLVCLDIMMPEKDGLEVLKEIRKKEKFMGITVSDEAKVIMITALDSHVTVLDAYYRGGCNDYLAKPVDTKKLKELLVLFGLV